MWCTLGFDLTRNRSDKSLAWVLIGMTRSWFRFLFLKLFQIFSAAGLSGDSYCVVPTSRRKITLLALYVNHIRPFLLRYLFNNRNNKVEMPQQGVNTHSDTVMKGRCTLFSWTQKGHCWSQMTFLFLNDVTHYMHNWMRKWGQINVNSRSSSKFMQQLL